MLLVPEEVALRVLFISTVAPYPKNVGKKVVLGGFCDYFKEACAPGDFELLCFEPAEVSPGVAAPVVSKPGMLEKIWNLGYFALLSRKKSIQEALFWSDRTLRDITKTIETFRPDIVIFDTVRAGQYLSRIPGKSFKAILYMDDLFSVRYERILSTMEKFPGANIDAMGNFASNIPRFLLPLYASSSAVKRLLLQLERHLVQHSEYTMPAGFDLALLISKDEVRHLKAHTPLQNIFAISPMPGGSEHAAPVRTWSGRPEFVFLGSLNLAHNAFSIENFIERHMDAMIATMPGCLLRVIGKGPSAQLLELAARYERNIVIEGFVEDLDVVLSGCAAMIAPLVFGSGVKIKTIDAVRLGVPVVATSYGAEGINATPGQGLFVEDDLSRFPDLCKHLLDQAFNREQSALSRQIYLKNYSKDAVVAQYEKLLLTR